MPRSSHSPVIPGDHPPFGLPPAAFRSVGGAMGAAVIAALLLTSIAANSVGEAERISAAQGDGYTRALVGGLTVHHSKPQR